MSRRCKPCVVLSLSFAAAALASALAQAEIRYSVQPVGDCARIKITMRFRVRPGLVALQAPDWSPGDYTLEVYEWTNIADDPGHPPIGSTCFDVTVTGP